MSMRRRSRERQPDLWISASDLAKTPGHPFYERLNGVLREAKFDDFVEERCERFYATAGKGRPSIPPGTYMRMLLIGFFEGIDSERGIAWRCSDSLSLREFLGYDLSEKTPDHSSLSRIRQRLDLDVHEEVFTFVLKVLAQKGLLKGQTIGVDATTLEANAALRSIVRRDDGRGYEEFLTDLAKTSGIETPTREDLARVDKKRPKKGSNDDWKHPHDPDAKITKMKDGRTHLAHKAEHAIDMDSGAVLGVTISDATLGDSATLKQTMLVAAKNTLEIAQDPNCEGLLSDCALKELVADKGYHSNETMEFIDAVDIRSFVSEPRRGKRKWKGKDEARRGTYANRRRIKSDRGKRLLRRRGEVVERGFAHCLETGGMRRTHLRGHENIRKRYLVHVAAFNLSLVMRQMLGFGTPRGFQGRMAALFLAMTRLVAIGRRWVRLWVDYVTLDNFESSRPVSCRATVEIAPSSTGC